MGIFDLVGLHFCQSLIQFWREFRQRVELRLSDVRHELPEGAFHLILATAYVVELRRHGTVSVLVFAKSVALVFLGSLSLAGESAWVVPFSALTDGMMGAVVYWAHSRLAASPSSS